MPTPTPPDVLREAARRLLAAKALKTYVEGMYEEARQQHLVALQTAGVTQQRISSPTGAYDGRISLVAGRPAVAIDEEAAVAWLTRHVPSEVETIRRVRPAYLEAIRAASRQSGLGVDPQTGAAVEWATVRAGEPYLTLALSDELAQTVAQVVGQAFQAQLARQPPELEQ